MSSSDSAEEYRRRRRSRRSSRSRSVRAGGRGEVRSWRTRQRAGSDGSVKQHSSRAGQVLGANFAAVQAKIRALRKQRPSYHSPGSLLDHEIQPGQDISLVGRTQRMDSTAPHVPIPLDIELSKIDRTIRQSFSRYRPLPLYQGCSGGERSELSDSVLVHDHTERCFAYVC